jgi:nitrous oxidase accessory protein NosD
MWASNYPSNISTNSTSYPYNGTPRQLTIVIESHGNWYADPPWWQAKSQAVLDLEAFERSKAVRELVRKMVAVSPAHALLESQLGAVGRVRDRRAPRRAPEPVRTVHRVSMARRHCPRRA